MKGQSLTLYGKKNSSQGQLLKRLVLGSDYCGFSVAGLTGSDVNGVKLYIAWKTFRTILLYSIKLLSSSKALTFLHQAVADQDLELDPPPSGKL